MRIRPLSKTTDDRGFPQPSRWLGHPATLPLVRRRPGLSIGHMPVYEPQAGFGKPICEHMLGRHVFCRYTASGDEIPDMVIPNVNSFCTAMMFWVSCYS